jgi:LPXTG-site transpeptidase (sortase) family protein
MVHKKINKTLPSSEKLAVKPRRTVDTKTVTPHVHVIKKSPSVKTTRQPVFSIPLLHKKRVAIPLLVLALLSIVALLLLPNLPQVQATAQTITKSHPVLAAIAPSSFKPPDNSLPTSGNWLVIPAIDLKMAIIEGDSIDVLIKQVGVWHQTGDLSSNYSLAGHKLQYFRSVNQSLYHLNQLQTGDSGIYIITNGVARQYKVADKKIVDPSDVAILDPTKSPQLTIYTCNDFNNHSRLVITALPIL